MQLQAVIFDLDDTLMPERAAVDEAFDEVCGACTRQHPVDAAVLQRDVRRIARERFRASPFWEWAVRIGVGSWEAMTGPFDGGSPVSDALRDWTAAYQLAAWRDALALQGIRDDAVADELRAALMPARRRTYRPFPAVPAMLAGLRMRYRLAVLTNGIASIQQDKLHTAGLSDVFECVVMSGDLDIGKPDGRAFAHVLERLDLPAHAVLMVGNSLEADIAGAAAVGIRSVWIDLDGADGRPLPPLAQRIGCIGDLPAMLARTSEA